MSLCCKTTVRSSARVPAFKASTSPPTGVPAAVVRTAAVPSPGKGAVMKRDTSTRVLSAETESWRGLAPTLAVANVAPETGWSLSSWPVASSAR